MEVECSSTVNDLGYSGAVLFVQLMNRRYENASTVLTSNKGEHPWQQLSHA
jgi:DNA replication protein DnaC